MPVQRDLCLSWQRHQARKQRDEAAEGDTNMIEPLVACARAGCTEGEIVMALEKVFGDYRETPVF